MSTSAQLQDGAVERLRTRIMEIDRQVVALLAERVAVARSLGMAKRLANVPVLDPAQEAAVIRRAAEFARAEGLPEEVVRDVFWHVVGMCRREQVGSP